jgi:hypothetical protein
VIPVPRPARGLLLVLALAGAAGCGETEPTSGGGTDGVACAGLAEAACDAQGCAPVKGYPVGDGCAELEPEYLGCMEFASCEGPSKNIACDDQGGSWAVSDPCIPDHLTLCVSNDTPPLGPCVTVDPAGSYGQCESCPEAERVDLPGGCVCGAACTDTDQCPLVIENVPVACYDGTCAIRCGFEGPSCPPDLTCDDDAGRCVWP